MMLMDSPDRNALWTKLVAAQAQVARLYWETNHCIDEIEDLCETIEKAARVTNDEEILAIVQTVKKTIAAEIAENTKSFADIVGDSEISRTSRADLIQDVLAETQELQRAMQASRDRAFLLREKLKRLVPQAAVRRQ